MKKYRFEEFVINSTQKKVPSPEDYAKYIGLEHMDTKNIHITRWGSSVPIKGEKLVMKKGDILLGKRNAYLRRSAIAPFDGIFSAHGMVLRPKEDVVDKNFFALFIASDYFFDQAIKISVGSLSPTINWSDLKNLEFELPSLETQRKLANVLWAINDTVDSYKEMIEQSDELIKAKFIEMFGDPNSIIIKDTVIDAFEIRDDLRKPLNDGERKSMKDGVLYPYYGANGRVDNINKYLMDCEALCIAEDCGSYGYGQDSSYIVRGKSWVNNHAHVLICKENCDIEYANVFFRLLDMTKIVNGTTRQKLTQGSLKNVPMFIPPIAEQKIFRNYLTIIEDNKEKLLKCIKSASLLYGMIITKYLTKEEN